MTIYFHKHKDKPPEMTIDLHNYKYDNHFISMERLYSQPSAAIVTHGSYKIESATQNHGPI